MRGTQWWRLMRASSTLLPFYYPSSPDSSRVGSSFWADVGSVRPTKGPVRPQVQLMHRSRELPTLFFTLLLFVPLMKTPHITRWQRKHHHKYLAWSKECNKLESFCYDYLVLKETTTYNEIDLRVKKMMLGRRQVDGCDGPEDRTTRQARPRKREFSKELS